jgi:hypothetical protein
MKKLNKLQINPEKLMKKEELIALRGGTNCICQNGGSICATGTAGSASECQEMCNVAPGCGSEPTIIYFGY